MKSKARVQAARDPFLTARAQFDGLVDWLNGERAPRTQVELEKGLVEQGSELLRQLLQGRFDLLLERERAELACERRDPRVQVRIRPRQLETQVGRVVLRRHGRKRLGEAARFALDEELNLPADLYSHPLRERVAEKARRGAWQQAVEHIDVHTGGHVPKRQAQELAEQATQDFEAFYEERVVPSNDTLGTQAHLIASCDSKGISMRAEALRDATRKMAEVDQAEAVRGDPMAAKNPRRHGKRMAIVTAVWEQEPHHRRAQEIVERLQPKAAKPSSSVPKGNTPPVPRPQHKRVWASAEKDQAEGIAEMFDEVARRDTTGKRTVVVLIDGEEHQESNVIQEAARRHRSLILVLDIIHVLSYLWQAGFALCQKDEKLTEVWVQRFLLKLLTAPVSTVIADIKRSSTQRGLSNTERAPVDKCLKYFTQREWMMKYPEALALGLPIATGIIEGCCRHLVEDRLGITGARWGLDGAEAILKLRALQSSGDWSDYWRFHLQREALRNYAHAA